MTVARSSLVSVETTPWYHCVCRCVRKSFLFGKDPETGRDFSHRKKWVAERIKKLGAIFCVKVAAYAVMSNHYHVVVYLDKELAESLTDRQVLERWYSLFQRPFVGKKFLELGPGKLNEFELLQVNELITRVRERLYDLSWFMRCLNEYIARKANKEDGVNGRFWEGRFKSQALLDETALLAAMSYVDLNPVRAGVAKNVTECDYTSIQDRLTNKDNEGLMSFRDESSKHKQNVGEGLSSPIPCSFQEYLELVDWTGRTIRKEGRGYLTEKVPRLFIQLDMNPDGFLAFANNFLKKFGHAVGCPTALLALSRKRMVNHLKGMKTARQIFAKKAA